MSNSIQQSPGAWATDVAAAPVASAFLTAGGELAALIDGKDWAATPLGPQDTWPQSLRTVLRILVTSRYAMWLGWGPELTFFYNDAYAAMTLGAKHPWALGQPTSEVWAGDLAGTQAARRNRACAPARQPGTRACCCSWNAAVIPRKLTIHFPTARCRTMTAPSVACCASSPRTPNASSANAAWPRCANWQSTSQRCTPNPTCAAAIEAALITNQRDLPFTVTWLFDTDAGRARLACVTGIERGHPIAAMEIDIACHPAG